MAVMSFLLGVMTVACVRSEHVRGQTRPAVKAIVRCGIVQKQRIRRLTAEAGEDLEDWLAEVDAEHAR